MNNYLVTTIRVFKDEKKSPLKVRSTHSKVCVGADIGNVANIYFVICEMEAST